MAQYLCLVTVISNVDGGNRPDNTLPVPQPPQPPLGIWGPTDPRPGWGLPGSQPHPDQGLPGNQPYPDQGLPGNQPYPDQGLPRPPGRPTHPIYNPPYPSQGLPPFPSNPIYIPPSGAQPPLGIWGPTDPRPGYGLPGDQPKPSHPIVLPPDLPEETPEGGKIDWKTAWTPVTGWVVIGIPAEGTLVPTPSK
jgi:hypothetical protein